MDLSALLFSALDSVYWHLLTLTSLSTDTPNLHSNPCACGWDAALPSTGAANSLLWTSAFYLFISVLPDSDLPHCKYPCQCTKPAARLPLLAPTGFLLFLHFPQFCNKLPFDYYLWVILPRLSWKLCSLSMTHVHILEVLNPTELDLILWSILTNNCQQQVLTLLTCHCVLTIKVNYNIPFPVFLHSVTMSEQLQQVSLTQSLPSSLNASTEPSPSQRAPVALELQLTKELKGAECP